MHKHALIPMFFLLFIVPLLLAPTVLTGADGESHVEMNSETSPVAPVTVADSSGVGSTPLISNVIKNGGFEDWNEYNAPIDWNPSTNGEMVVDVAYQLETYDGIYGARVFLWATEQSGQWAYLAQGWYAEPRPYLVQGLSLGFWLKIVQSPSVLDGSVSIVKLEMTNGASWKYMEYYTLYSETAGNNSQYCRFGLNSTLGVWTAFDRNVTADYESGFGESVGSYYIRSIYVQCSNSRGSPTASELLLDEVSLENRTGAEFLTNGDFETGTGSGWDHSGRTHPSSIRPSTNRQQGQWSANFTTTGDDMTTSSSSLAHSLGYPQGSFPLNVGTGLVQFWYRFSGNATPNVNAYFEMYFQNETAFRNIRFYLDSHSYLSPNSTEYWYMRARDAGAVGVWHHEVIDVGVSLRETGAMSGSAYYLQFVAYAGWASNVRAELLIDDFRYNDYPAHDAGFEQDFYPYTSNPLPGWYAYDYPYTSKSEDAYAGKYAARLMSENGVWYSFSRDVYLPYSTGIYFDMWWKLDSIGSYPSTYYTGVMIELDDVFRVHYMFTYVPGSVGNSSSEAYFKAEGFNQTGLWNNLRRNFTDDYQQAFGAAAWNVTRIMFEAYSATSSPVIVLLDEVHFVDGAPPEIQSIERVTATPVYYEPVVVRMSVTDSLAGVAEVGVIYDSSSGSGAILAEDTGGGVYEAVIPAFPWGTLVGWCVIAADRCGSWALDDNDGAAYTYTVGDDVNPAVEITSPESLSVVTGQIVVHVDASDAGSGVHEVDFYLDSVFQDTDYSPPYEFAVNTRTLANGTHLLGTVAYDYANLTWSDEVEVKVNNDYSGPALSTVQTSPDNPEYDEEVTVIVAASDFTDVKNVTLFYRFGLDSWTAVTMSKSATLYTADIPGAPWNTHVSYYVEAYDTFDQKAAVGSETSPMSYTTTDSKAPTIGVTGPPVNLPQSGIVNFTVHVADIGSGVASTEMVVDGNTVLTRSLSSFAASWDTSGLENGVHTVMFVVQDRAGNSAAVSFEYTVHNPVGLDPFINGLAGLFAGYGFFIGIGTAIIIFAIAKLVIGRRRP